MRSVPKRFREIWYALIAIVAITAIYVVAYRQAGAFPAASGLVGHGIGILGFFLILMTETLYSIRKQLTTARWGSMAGWLRFHMVTGLVGPYMVLLHTSMRFHGLAGVAMLLTVVVVISGLVGRYIYTVVPRAIDGAEPDETASLTPRTDEAGESQALTARRQSSDRRLHRLAAQRGALATWRSVHVPLTWALVVTALVHIVAALYYATFQR